MIKITFPDSAVKEFESGTTTLAILGLQHLMLLKVLATV